MKILFLGRKPAAAEALRWTVAQGHEVVGVVTDSHLPGSPTTAAALALNLPVMSLQDVYGAIGRGDMQPDLAVSFVFWQKIREPLLGAPAQGIINFHPAPLPDYKGTAGYNLAILDGLSEWSVTAHYVDAGIDTGPIIDSFHFSIDPEEETLVRLEARSQEFLLDLYCKTVRRVSQGESLSTRPNIGGRYVTRKEMEELKRVLPDDDVDRKIRAFWFPPYTGAFVEIAGTRYTLVNQRILSSLAPANTTNLHQTPTNGA
jgi:methionyl-tRNA formyltransferase